MAYTAAPDYERHPYFREKVTFLTENAFPKIGGGGRLLDYGCGQGHYSIALARCGYTVNGVDSNTDRLVEATDAAVAAGVADQVSFFEVPLTADSLTFDDDAFDVVWASEIIEHIPDVLAWLVEIKRVLRRGGLLLITTPNCVSYRHVGKTALRGARPEARAATIDRLPQYMPGKEGHIYSFEFDTLYRLLSVNGFSRVASRYGEPHDWWRNFTNVVPLFRPFRTGLELIVRHDDPDQIYR